MILSKSCEYAVRAVIYISLNSKNDKKTGIKEVSDTLEIPAPFLAKILQTLVKVKILNSTKGPHGGFYVDKNPQKIFLADIIEAIDGLEVFKKCAIGLKKCSETKPCPVHHLVKEFRDKARKAFAGKNLAEAIMDIEEKRAFI